MISRKKSLSFFWQIFFFTSFFRLSLSICWRTIGTKNFHIYSHLSVIIQIKISFTLVWIMLARPFTYIHIFPINAARETLNNMLKIESDRNCEEKKLIFRLCEYSTYSAALINCWIAHSPEWFWCLSVRFAVSLWAAPAALTGWWCEGASTGGLVRLVTRAPLVRLGKRRNTKLSERLSSTQEPWLLSPSCSRCSWSESF